MKTLLIVILNVFLLSSSPSHKFNSIDNIKQQDKIRAGSSSLLNEKESAYLNKLFEMSRNDFDFCNKKVGFINSYQLVSKVDYFNTQKKLSINEHYPNNDGELYILNAAQKRESGSYDAAIIYYCKF